MLENAKRTTPTKPQAQNWMNMSVGRSGFHLAAIASFYDSAIDSWSSHELRSQLEINHRQYAKDHYELLILQKAEIEEEMGEPLVWHNPDDARACRIYVQQSTDLEDLDAREEQYAWLLKKLEKLHKVFVDRVRELKIPESEI